jgi:hypothetical protein
VVLLVFFENVRFSSSSSSSSSFVVVAETKKWGLRLLRRGGTGLPNETFILGLFKGFLTCLAARHSLVKVHHNYSEIFFFSIVKSPNILVEQNCNTSNEFLYCRTIRVDILELYSFGHPDVAKDVFVRQGLVLVVGRPAWIQKSFFLFSSTM